MNLSKNAWSNLVICILLASAVFLAARLWLDFPGSEKKIQEDVESDKVLSEDSLLKIFRPEHLLVRTEDGKSYMLRDSNDFFAENIEKIKDIFLDLSGKGLEQINEELYIQLLSAPSVTMCFDTQINTRALVNLLGSQKRSDLEKSIPFEFSEVYLGQNGLLCIKNKQGYFLFKGKAKGIDIEDYIKNVKKQNPPEYYCLREKYGSKNNVYYPKDYYICSEKIKYVNGLENLTRKYKLNFAERFLKSDINYIGEIQEQDVLTYVYGLRSLKLRDDGSLFYTNGQDPKEERPNFYKSLEAALNFIGELTGIEDDLYISKIEEIDSQAHKGFKIYCNFRQDSFPIILKEEASYIEVEAYNDFIKSYRQFYRRPYENPGYYMEKIHPVSPEKIFESYMSQKNIDIKNYAGDFLAFLNSVKSIRPVYLDSKEGEFNGFLKPALEIVTDGGKIYMDPKNANIIMEVK